MAAIRHGNRLIINNKDNRRFTEGFGKGAMNTEQQKKYAPMGLVVGCVVCGLGSVIVAHVPVGAYAIAFWRLTVAAFPGQPQGAEVCFAGGRDAGD